MHGKFPQLPRPGWTTTATSTCFIASVSTSMHSYNRRWLAIWGVGGGVSSCFMTVLEVFLCETRVAGGQVFWTPRPTPRQFSTAKSLVGMNLWKSKVRLFLPATCKSILSTFGTLLGNVRHHSLLCQFFHLNFPSIFTVSQKPRNKKWYVWYIWVSFHESFSSPQNVQLISWVLDLKFDWFEGFFLV